MQVSATTALEFFALPRDVVDAMAARKALLASVPDVCLPLLKSKYKQPRGELRSSGVAIRYTYIHFI